MIIALYCVAAAMVLGGVYSAIIGWEIVILERGWTQVLSGVIVGTAGVLLAAIAFLAGELRKLQASLQMRGDTGMPAAAPGETALAAHDRDESRPAGTAPSAAPLTGAAALALAGLGKAKGDPPTASALPDQGIPDAAPAVSEHAPEERVGEPDHVDASAPEPPPRFADEFLARAAEAEAREAEARAAEEVEAAEVEAEQQLGDVAHDAAPRPEGELRDAVADALFAEDRPGAQERAATPPADTAPPAPDTPAPDTFEPVASPSPAFDEDRAPTIIEDAAPNMPFDDPAARPDASAAPEAPAADAQQPEAVSPESDEAAISREQERFGALLAMQTTTGEPEYAPALPDQAPEMAGEPEITPEPEPVEEPELVEEPESVEEPSLPPAHTAFTEEAAAPVTPPPEPEPEPEIAPEPEVAREPEPEPQEPAEERSIIGTYESGGNTYTMYADGSIDADTPDGNYHFGSLDELKTFIAEGGESRNA